MAMVMVGEPVGRAMSRAGLVLFRPFAWKKWVTIAVAAWLANINEWNGFGALPNLIFQAPIAAAEHLEEVADFINGHMAAVMAAIVVLAVVFFAIYVLYRWASCRGQLMMLEAVVENGISVRESWSRHRVLGNSLLKFRIAWDVVIFNVLLLIVTIAWAMAWQDLKVLLNGEDYRPTAWTVAAVAFGLVSMAGATVLTMVAMVFLEHLVVPVIFVRQMRAGAAFRHAWREMLMREKKACVLYLLMMVLAECVHGLAMMIGMIAVILGTLCIGYVLMLIPILSLAPIYVAVAAGLPVEVFVRSCSLYFVGQFGEEYQVAWRGAAPTGFPVIASGEFHPRDTGSAETHQDDGN